ncbi:unnamed protein product [Auanema sp. JU1783]|nr:unnamed protein product [Auanema sp. JU1783]
MFRGLLGSMSDYRMKLSNDDQIRYFGWALLVVWTLSIIYMTRDFWFPSAFGLPPLSERMRAPRFKREKRNMHTGRMCVGVNKK